MKTINELGLRVPEILLPKNIDLKSWSVIACDQYTQDRDYWKKAEAATGGKPSTLNLILPEVYLNSPDKAERIGKIRETMNSYLAEGVFDSPRKSMIYIERKTAFGRCRQFGTVPESADAETLYGSDGGGGGIRPDESGLFAGSEFQRRNQSVGYDGNQGARFKFGGGIGRIEPELVVV